VHFWIGAESTQDEYGTAAYKTVELDDKLGGEPVQHREVQENESRLFLSYFGGQHITYLSGFRHVEAEQREVRMLQVKGRAGEILLTEVALSRASMNSGDVFILDTQEAIFQWNGSGANAHEKSQAAQFCQALRGDRGGAVRLHTFTEGIDDQDGQGASDMWSHLPGERKFLGIKVADIKIRTSEKGGDDEAVSAFVPTLYRLTAGGSLKRVWRKKQRPPISKLKADGVYLLDTGFELNLWVGGTADRSLKGEAFMTAQKYLKRYRRPPVLPIHRHAEGREPSELKALFGPAEEPGCCGCFG